MCVLLVEDDVLIREIMSETLQDAGYEVIEAEHGVAALLVLDMPPRTLTVVLTDFHMPGDVDGSHVAEKARTVFPGIPVIIASGRPDVLQPKWQTELGYRFLKKPYYPSELVKIIQALIGRPAHHPVIAIWFRGQGIQLVLPMTRIIAIIEGL